MKYLVPIELSYAKVGCGKLIYLLFLSTFPFSSSSRNIRTQVSRIVLEA